MTLVEASQNVMIVFFWNTILFFPSLCHVITTLYLQRAKSLPSRGYRWCDCCRPTEAVSNWTKEVWKVVVVLGTLTRRALVVHVSAVAGSWDDSGWENLRVVSSCHSLCGAL